MEKKKSFILIFLAIALAITLACGISFDGGGDDDSESLKLQLTQQSLQMTQAALSGMESGSSSGGSDDPAPEPDAGGVSDDDEEEEEDDGIPCNDSHIIGESVKDGTVFKPGEKFEKTWTLRNEGDCDWTTAYVLRFIEGNQLGGASSIKVPSVIEPNEDITFKLNLTAPDKEGEYTGVWQLFAGDGEELGRYWVVITVAKPEPEIIFAVTSVNLANVVFPNDLTCPYNTEVTISITANAAGKVTYRIFDSSIGNFGPLQTLNFDAAGTKNIPYDLGIFAAGEATIKVRIDDPNNQTFGPFSVFAICT